jgi:hypothetical protein
MSCPAHRNVPGPELNNKWFNGLYSLRAIEMDTTQGMIQLRAEVLHN